MEDVVIGNKRDFEVIVGPLIDSYQPNDTVNEQTLHVDLTTVTGPAGVGKNTVMSEASLWCVVSDTTRDPRSNDGVMEIDGREYQFRGGELSKVYQDVVLGNYVQIEKVNMAETGIDVYGSRNEAYPTAGPALIDVVATAVEKIRALRKNFKSIESIYIVAEDFKSWIDRFDGRGSLPPKVREKRLHEARGSLEYGLEKDSQMTFILNMDKKVAGRTLQRFAETRGVNDSIELIARNCGYKMLKGLAVELGEPLIYPLS